LDPPGPISQIPVTIPVPGSAAIQADFLVVLNRNGITATSY
jgi:hypothetical protein